MPAEIQFQRFEGRAMSLILPTCVMWQLRERQLAPNRPHPPDLVIRDAGCLRGPNACYKATCLASDLGQGHKLVKCSVSVR